MGQHTVGTVFGVTFLAGRIKMYACECGCFISLLILIKHNGCCPDCGVEYFKLPKDDETPKHIPDIIIREEWPDEWFD